MSTPGHSTPQPGSSILAAMALCVTILAATYVRGALGAIHNGVQAAAEAAALAAAWHLMWYPEQFEEAAAEANMYANLNRIFGYVPEVRPEYMIFDDTAASVTVQAQVTLFRMPRVLAALGLPDGVVTAQAAAEGRASGRARPIKVLKLVDECYWGSPPLRRSENRGSGLPGCD